MSKSTNWAICLLAGLLSACAPTYSVHVKPATEGSRWEDGVELVAAVADSVEARMGIVSTVGPWLEFEVTVRNRSARPVLVAPEQFYLDASGWAAAETREPWRIPASNPEETLGSLQQAAAYHEDKSTTVPAGEVLSTVGSLLDDLSSKKRKETTEQRNAREAAYQAEQNRYEQERTDHAVRAVAAREELHQLEQTLLRKTTLDPGYALHGRVRFRRFADGATRLRMVVPVAGRELAGEFTQQRYRPNGRPLPVAQTMPTAVPKPLSPSAPQVPATVRP